MPLARFNFHGEKKGGRRGKREREGKGRERVVTRESVHCHRSVRGYGIVYLVYRVRSVFDNPLEVGDKVEKSARRNHENVALA